MQLGATMKPTKKKLAVSRETLLQHTVLPDEALSFRSRGMNGG
jgi:hypothetical protein